MLSQPHLNPRPVNHQPLTPADFLVRTAQNTPEKLATIWRRHSWTYGEFSAMAARLAAFLKDQGIQKGDGVAIVAANRPEMLAAHFAVPAIGAILNTINTRLDPAKINYILEHSDSRILLVSEDNIDVINQLGGQTIVPVTVLGNKSDSTAVSRLDLISPEHKSEDLTISGIDDEWQPICLNHTSGTTSNPKGAVHHHRGAYLNVVEKWGKFPPRLLSQNQVTDLMRKPCRHFAKPGWPGLSAQNTIFSALFRAPRPAKSRNLCFVI